MKYEGNTYLTILEDKLLSRAFKYILANNTSNIAPYHHFHHMISVTRWSMLLAQYEGFTEGSTKWYELTLASMFHDMNHSMGKLPDIENVNNAISEFCKFYEEYNSVLMGYDINEDRVNKIIRATQYPYMIPDEELNECQAIIRDADLLVSLEPDWFQNAFLGLMQEMKVDDIRKMIEGQMAFHKGITMRTEFAIDLYNDMWPIQIFPVIESLKKLYDEA